MPKDLATLRLAHERAAPLHEEIPYWGWLEDGRTLLTVGAELVTLAALETYAASGRPGEYLDFVLERWVRLLAAAESLTRVYLYLLRRPARGFASGVAAEAAAGLVADLTPLEILPPERAAHVLSELVNAPGHSNGIRYVKSVSCWMGRPLVVDFGEDTAPARFFQAGGKLSRPDLPAWSGMAAERDIDPRIERLQSTSFCGKHLTRRQIADIQETVGRFPQLSRTELGQTLCEQLGWQTPKGRNRIQLAMRVLEQLEQRGILALPAKQGPGRGRQKPVEPGRRSDPQPAIAGPLAELRPLRLELAKGAEAVAEWNEWVQRYHPPGYRQPLGAHLRYFLLDRQGRKLGCLLFDFAARQLACRDAWIGWWGEGQRKRLERVVRNARYLLFPWVGVKKLASHALGLALQQLAQDWQRVGRTQGRPAKGASRRSRPRTCVPPRPVLAHPHGPARPRAGCGLGRPGRAESSRSCAPRLLSGRARTTPAPALATAAGAPGTPRSAAPAVAADPTAGAAVGSAGTMRRCARPTPAPTP